MHQSGADLSCLTFFFQSLAVLERRGGGEVGHTYFGVLAPSWVTGTSELEPRTGGMGGGGAR